jgi:hypothetical protein
MADPREIKMSPGIGDESKGRDPIERMLEQAERGKLGGTLRQSRPEGTPYPRPFQAPPRDYSTPPSKAPRGMANEVMGDIGAYRQQEAVKVFGAQGGKSISNPLRYRKPETAIDAKYGPGDKVC